MMIKKSNLILVLLFTISALTFSCSNDDDKSLLPTLISQEIKDLIYFRGDENASVVLVNVQGADTELSTDEVDEIFQNFNTTNLLIVNVHQAQTLNPSIVQGNDLTLNQAIDFNAESIEILNQVVKYFKDQGRTVYVLGISFGAFMAQDLIAKKGMDAADNYLFMAGRLDMNDVIWQAFSEGQFGYFENGINPILDPEPVTDVTERNLNRLAAGLAMNRYTELLDNFQDLSKITYVYGALDDAVGRLTGEEVQFLESKNVNIIAGNGNHDDTIGDFIVQGFGEAFGIEIQ